MGGTTLTSLEKSNLRKEARIRFIEGELSRGISIDDFDSIHQFNGVLGYRAKLKKELQELINN